MLKHQGHKIIRRRLSSLRRVRAAILLFGVSFTLMATVATIEYSSLLAARQAKEQMRPAPTPSNYLHVITRISPNTYFESDEGPSGFEYALLDRFAKYLGKELSITTTDSLADLFNRLERREAHLASAGLTATPARLDRFTFSVPYLESQPVVVYRVGNKKPRRPADLIDSEIVVVADSSHSAMLENMRKTHPEIQWRELNNVDYIDVLGRIEDGEFDYTLLDSTEFMLHRGFFPRVKKAFSIGEKASFAWAMPKSLEQSDLHRAANRFLEQIKSDGTLAKLEEQYYGQAVHINQVAANEFAKNIDAKLPLYRDNIKSIANEFDMDWRLLAAISYQESGWNPLAKSRTGVRGLMMLTLPTAKEVGVTDRLDPVQSLRGGAKYLTNLKRRLPKSIVEPDRSWFALAAYNVGMGHLEDARVITQKSGGDPSSWFDVKRSLPLLTQKKWHKTTRYGYARGYEPVQYVQHIRHYHNVLVWSEIARNWQPNEDSTNAFVRDFEFEQQEFKKTDMGVISANEVNGSTDAGLDSNSISITPNLKSAVEAKDGQKNNQPVKDKDSKEQANKEAIQINSAKTTLANSKESVASPASKAIQSL